MNNELINEKENIDIAKRKIFEAKIDEYNERLHKKKEKLIGITINGYKTKYAVSSLGYIYNLKNHKIIEFKKIYSIKVQRLSKA